MGTGAIGDAYPKKYVLTISFTIQAVLFAAVGYAGIKAASDIENRLILFCILFGTIGAI